MPMKPLANSKRNDRPDELSTWDGNVPGQANDKRMLYARLGMWLTRPRLIREFRGYSSADLRSHSSTSLPMSR